VLNKSCSLILKMQNAIRIVRRDLSFIRICSSYARTFPVFIIDKSSSKSVMFHFTRLEWPSCHSHDHRCSSCWLCFQSKFIVLFEKYSTIGSSRQNSIVESSNTHSNSYSATIESIFIRISWNEKRNKQIEF